MTLGSFLLTTIYWANFVASFVTQIRLACVDDVNISLSARFGLSNEETYTPDTVQLWAIQILVCGMFILIPH